MNIGRIEATILQSLLYNVQYCRQVLPYLEAEFFEEKAERLLCKTLKDYVQKYDKVPTPEAMYVVLHDARGVSDDDYHAAVAKLGEIATNQSEHVAVDDAWLIDQTDKFAKDRAMYNAVQTAIHIVTGESKDLTSEAIPELITKALAVSLKPATNTINLPTTDTDEMLARLCAQETEGRFPFQASLSTLNAVTRGGLKHGETALMLAGSGVGKTKWLCNLASQYAQQGLGVLYVNLESEASDIWRTVAANLIGVASDEIHLASRLAVRPVQALNIMIHDYNGTATPPGIPLLIQQKLRRYIKEHGIRVVQYDALNHRKPDVVIIDYMSEMTPTQTSKNDNTYQAIGRIYRELLDIARGHNVLIWSAAQFNREGVRETKRKDGGKASVEHVGDSYQQVTKATLLLKLELFHTEGPIGYMNAEVLKYRHNNDWRKFQMELQYPLARFREMSPDEWAEVVVAKVGTQKPEPVTSSSVFNAATKRKTIWEQV